MMRRLTEACVHLLYPPLCLHCRDPLDPGAKIFCQACVEQLELIDSTDRCPYCYSSAYQPEQRFCPDCYRRPPILDKIAAAFDYVGPAATLIRQLKYGDQPYLAEGAGAYLAAQFLRLEWPLPDYVVPVPMSFMHWLDRGYNQSKLLADAVAGIIRSPVQDLLYRRSGDYSQAGLSRWQRQELDGQTIRLKSTLDFRDSTLLLIDDVMTTGSTLRKCAEALMEGAPARIYGLVLCRAVL